ncbi:MAG: phosphoglycerate kinase, partial [bacterium]|nr:phosphoglycerate kinase [bacterium]
KVVEDLKTTAHASYLSEKLNQKVIKLDDCVGEQVTNVVKSLKAGEVVMLENVRFHKEETADDDEFAKKLVVGMDAIVFDAFPQAHRKHASTTGILRHLDAVAGLYFEKEYTQITKIIDEIERPFVAVIGGAKVSDKVLAIKKLANIADVVLVGGGVANAFLYQQGFNIAQSYVENTFVDGAQTGNQDIKQIVSDILSDKKQIDLVIPNGIKGVENSNIILPIDFMIDVNGKNEAIRIDQLGKIDNFQIKDIGPQTITMYKEILEKTKTIFWNGPIGVFEQDEYSLGSRAILSFMKKYDGLGLIAGGDSITLIDKFDDISNFKYISLAGGATLDIISGKSLAVMPYLQK